MKVFAIHPGKQHSFQLATALKKKGILGKYITSVYNKPHSYTNLLLKFSKGDLKKKLEGRKCNDLDDQDVVQINELGVIFTLFLNKFPSFQKLAEYWNLYIESSFYKKVMKLVRKEQPDAIVIYNGYSNKHLDLIRDMNIIKIMDMSIAKREYIQQILQQEINETNLWQIKHAHFSYWNKHMLKNDINGCKQVDFFLVPSTFVKNSLIQNGINESQIKIVPYGVNIKQFTPTFPKKISTTLKLIYVGSVTYRKGMHRLLHTIKDLKNVELFLAGTYDKTSDLYQQYNGYSHIHFLGFVTRDKLNKLYNECNVFVLPSLCEGMAMVGLEAMACGLPLICTFYTGVNDVIENGINGFVYKVNEEQKLKEYIIWFQNNKDKIESMSRNARETALKYSWENYHQNVSNAIIECIKSKQK